MNLDTDNARIETFQRLRGFCGEQWQRWGSWMTYRIPAGRKEDLNVYGRIISVANTNCLNDFSGYNLIKAISTTNII